MQVITFGIDLAKNVFQIHGVDVATPLEETLDALGGLAHDVLGDVSAHRQPGQRDGLWRADGHHQRGDRRAGGD